MKSTHGNFTNKLITAGDIPRYGQIWEFKGNQVCILGNYVYDDNTIWVADWKTGKRIHPNLMELIPIAITEKDTFSEVTERCTEWARNGNSSAAWWLGWRWEGINHPKSIWYYVAAIRLSPKYYGWALNRIQSDSIFGCMCSDTPQPDISFLKCIPEMAEGVIEKEWQVAISEAESAVHKLATVGQIETAIDYLRSGIQLRNAAFKANITEQFLTNSTNYKIWYAAESEMSSRRNEIFWVGFHSLDDLKFLKECPYAPDAVEKNWWCEGRDAAREAMLEYLLEENEEAMNAYQLARRLHNEQVDKAGRPYIEHLTRVFLRVHASGGDIAQKIAALLHDCIEDGKVSVAQLSFFGVSSEAIDLIEVLTKTKSTPYAEYLSKVKSEPRAILVKLADIEDNSDPERLAMLPEVVALRLRQKYADAAQQLNT